MNDQDRRVAVIADVVRYVNRLLHALGITDDTWPDDLHVTQLGDPFGGRADLDGASIAVAVPTVGRSRTSLQSRSDGAMGRGEDSAVRGATDDPRAQCDA